ncbi:hypothetical protein [Hymenobacter sp. BRD67]|uniref:hypothetical protein n=1 Tax=Hymenobacter sp. BRD67 TaxID=2675877 RepID=UPI0015632CDB|nr:hypothetical protein [Hymenobacter sp. BRD67]QKG51921.1 hypothetical protein GKZ67_03955 [Hymenobacter sp. BRD67]
MTCQRAHHCRSRLAWQMLALALLALLALRPACAQTATPALARLVQPAPGTRPLGTVLAELSRQGHLPLSYSSSLVPVAHSCTLRPGPARPLKVVLREVLAAEHLSYGLLNGQLVLWPDRVAAPPGVAAVNGQAASASVPAASPSSSAVAAGRAGEAAQSAVSPRGSSASDRPERSFTTGKPVPGNAPAADQHPQVKRVRKPFPTVTTRNKKAATSPRQALDKQALPGRPVITPFAGPRTALRMPQKLGSPAAYSVARAKSVDEKALSQAATAARPGSRRRPVRMLSQSRSPASQKPALSAASPPPGPPRGP